MDMMTLALECIDMINMIKLLKNRTLCINTIRIVNIDDIDVYHNGRIQWVLSQHEFCWYKPDTFWEYRVFLTTPTTRIDEWTRKQWVPMTERTTHAMSQLIQVHYELVQLSSFRLMQL